jgi:hypothetical protein
MFNKTQILICVIFISFMLYKLGVFKRIMYGSLFNDKRIEVGIEPFISNWRYEKQDGGDVWFNPIEKKEGLNHRYKQQSFKHNESSVLVSELDCWTYKEGDFINLNIYHYYLFDPEYPFGNARSNGKNSNHVFDRDRQTDSILSSYGQSVKDSLTFFRTINYLRKREDSLKIN